MGKPFDNAIRINESLYNTHAWRVLKKKVLKDNPYCMKCGISRADGALLEVHHLRPARGDSDLFFDEHNLGVLCTDCHKKITGKEIGKRKRLCHNDSNRYGGH
jgi:5-methylcytosine-specific restriction protein A